MAEAHGKPGPYKVDKYRLLRRRGGIRGRILKGFFSLLGEEYMRGLGTPIKCDNQHIEQYVETTA